MGTPATCSETSLKVRANAAGANLAHLAASVPAPGADPRAAAQTAYQQIARLLADEQLVVIHERLFGSLSVSSAVLQARSRALKRAGMNPASPITYIEGRPVWGEGFAGVLVQAVRRSSDLEAIWTIADTNGTPCGRGCTRRGVSFLVLQNLHGLEVGRAADNSARAQAARMFDRADALLRGQGGSYRNVARTWIYLRRILDWYDEFNHARNAAYERFGLMPDPLSRSPDQPLALPASTGIGGDNPLGAACVMDLLAVVEPPDAPSIVTQMTSVRQKDAFRYGSAFSRGAALQHPDFLQIEISGTAAIGEHGESLCPNDIRPQIDSTLSNVEALLAQRGATLRDIHEATVFFKRPQDAAVYSEIVAARGLTALPAVCVVADICRDELLFEIDGTAAIRSRPR